MSNKTIENARAKVERLEKLETSFTVECDDVLSSLKALTIQKMHAIESAAKSDKSILKAQLKKLKRAIKLFEGGNE